MDLFDEACDQPVSEQRRIVRQLFARDADLAKRLAELLQHDSDERDVLARGGAKLWAQQLSEAEMAASGVQRADVLVGRYQVGMPLGAGGTGTVHRGRHIDTGQQVALKFLKTRALADRHTVRRMTREYRALARLSHVNCVQVIDYIESSLGGCIVMELVSGGHLGQLEGASEALRIELLHGVACGLSYIHEQGVVHRDLKPENVLLTNDEPPIPKIADFGIAKVTGSSTTAGSGVVGTIDALSPEQLDGHADARSDLYALGCLVFRLWTGQAPFLGDNFQRLDARLRGPAPSLAERAPDAPAELVALTARLLMRDPEARPQSGGEVADALRAMMG